MLMPVQFSHFGLYVYFKCTLLQIDFTLLSGCEHLCLSVAHETPSTSFAVKKFHMKKKILRTMPLFKEDKGGRRGGRYPRCLTRTKEVGVWEGKRRQGE